MLTSRPDADDIMEVDMIMGPIALNRYPWVFSLIPHPIIIEHI